MPRVTPRVRLGLASRRSTPDAYDGPRGSADRQRGPAVEDLGVKAGGALVGAGDLLQLLRADDVIEVREALGGSLLDDLHALLVTHSPVGLHHRGGRWAAFRIVARNRRLDRGLPRQLARQD